MGHFEIPSQIADLKCITIVRTEYMACNTLTIHQHESMHPVRVCILLPHLARSSREEKGGSRGSAG